MTLTHEEFIRRLLLHVLPDGFQRIRHYAFSATANGQSTRALSALLGVATATVLSIWFDWTTGAVEQATGLSLERCPV